MARHDKPITSSQLYRWLADEMGCPIREGRNGQPVATIGSAEVKLPPAGKKRDVNINILQNVARAMGVPLGELKEALGQSAHRAGKPGVEVAREWAGPSKGDVVGLGRELAETVNRINQWAAKGSHDGKLYQRLHESLSVATKALDGWPPAVDADGYESPDDSGYKPRAYDSIETGAARATGHAAAAAKQRKTFTKWQIDEKEAAS